MAEIDLVKNIYRFQFDPVLIVLRFQGDRGSAGPPGPVGPPGIGRLGPKVSNLS